MRKEAQIGIIGCGNISEAFLRLASVFNGLHIAACADIVPEAAQARAKAFGIRALTVDQILKDSEIGTLINLTVPAAHYEVTSSILSAGKHAYSEKPLALTAVDANKLVAAAASRGLKLGCAPDTILGAASQTARRLIDEGAIGHVLAGTAHVMNHGMENWHPNPTFFYKPGGGPIFDIGPYYIAGLVNLIGPVRAVTATASIAFPERIVTSEPRKGERIVVETPTTISALLEFRSGAQVTLGASWDVWRHGHANPIELYGTDGTMLLPDTNYFGGVVSYSNKAGDYTARDTADQPFGAANWPPAQRLRANYRMLGVAELVAAAAEGREPRCSGRLAAHVVEVMESILIAARDRRFVAIESVVPRPDPLTPAEAARLARTATGSS
jgi:predicted dehydrogenase